MTIIKYLHDDELGKQLAVHVEAEARVSLVAPPAEEVVFPGVFGRLG